MIVLIHRLNSKKKRLEIDLNALPKEGDLIDLNIDGIVKTWRVVVVHPPHKRPNRSMYDIVVVEDPNDPPYTYLRS